MVIRRRVEARQIERYWASLRRHGAAAPPELDASLARVIDGLECELRPPQVSDAFVRQLWQQLEGQAVTEQPELRRWRPPALDLLPKRQPLRPNGVREEHAVRAGAAPAGGVAPGRPRRWLREGLALALAVLVFALVGALLALVLRGGPRTARPEAQPHATPVASPVTQTTSIRVGKNPFGAAVGAGALWVPNVGDGTLMRVDPATNRVVATIDLGANHAQVVEGQDLYILMPSAPVAVAASDTAIWVTRNASRSPTERTRDVLRIDPATNAIVATTPLEASPDMLALSEGAVWVISREAGLVLRVDTATNQVVATIAVDQPLSVSVGDGAVWVVSGPTPAVTPLRVVTRIDPATNSVADTFSFQDELLWVAWGDGALWAALPRANEVQRIDPATHAVTARIAVSSPGAIAVDGGAVWVKSGTGSALTTLTRIDAATNTVVATYSTGAPGGTLSVADGAVWVADTLGGRIIRIIP